MRKGQSADETGGRGMMWWQWLAIGYILGSAVTTLMVHVTRDKEDDNG